MTLGSRAYLNCPEDNGIYFDIKNQSNRKPLFWIRFVIHFFRSNSPRLKNLYTVSAVLRMVRLHWVPVLGIHPTYPSGLAGTKLINGYNQAVNGPNIGFPFPRWLYSHCIQPRSGGSYWFEFYRSNDGGLSMISSRINRVQWQQGHCAVIRYNGGG